MNRCALFITTMLVSTPVVAGTVMSGTLETPNGVSDQSILCSPNNGTYPAQFRWNPAKATGVARDATDADGFTPRIEQHRMISGVDTLMAAYSSFGSNTTTCQEVWQPADSGPFNAAQLQQMASSGCGAFGNANHVDLFRLAIPGDVFLVFPAVYKGASNHIELAPRGDYYTGNNPIYPPDGITIRGVTVNGIRPILFRDNGGQGDSESSKDAVEVEGGANDTIDNLTISMGDPNTTGGYVEQALIFLIGANTHSYDSNGNALPIPTPVPGGVFKLTHSRVTGSELMEEVSGGADGIISDNNSSGTLRFFADEIDHDGGSGVDNHSGIGHGMYLSASLTDPNLTASLQNNWFHDNYYGHDAKLRPQIDRVVGNYFEGDLPSYGGQGDAFNLDVPNAGQLTAFNNIFVKNASGYNSNGFAIAYGEEGVPSNPPDGANGATRKLSISIRFNTFVAFAATFDGEHPITPMEFFWNPSQVPGAQGFPVEASNTDISYNAFVGYCPTGTATYDFRGNSALIAGFGDLSQTFSLGGLWMAPLNNSGTNAYAHQQRFYKRATSSVGAED